MLFNRTIQCINPDLLITTEYPHTVASVVSGLHRKYKIISWQHSSFFQRKSILWKLFSNIAYRLIDCIVCLNKDEEVLYRTLNKNTVIIPNFTFNVLANADLSSRNIITIARLTHNKGIDILIETAKKVLIKHPEWRWKLIGTGELKSQIIRSIRSANLENKLTLIEPYTSDLVQDYSNSSIYVMTSRVEPFGMVLIEAMNHGLPCVAFDCKSGPRHIISHNEDGFLIENENSEKLAEAICLLIENEELRREMSTRAKKNVERFYNNKIIKHWDELLKKLLHY